jgi:hypothetical protein
VSIQIESKGGLAATLQRLLEHMRSAAEPALIIAPDLLISPLVLTPITEDNFAKTSAATRPQHDGNLRIAHHEIAAVATGFHRITTGNAQSVGAVRIEAKDFAAATHKP